MPLQHHVAKHRYRGMAPSGDNLKDPKQDQGHNGKLLLVFLCFDFVPFVVGGPRECKGYLAFLPTCGPLRR